MLRRASNVMNLYFKVMIFFLAIAVPGRAFAAACTPDPNTACVSTAGNLNVTGPNGICKNVANSHASGKTLMVPLNTTAEWTQFWNNPPLGVTVAACTCAGAAVGGYCWYLGAASASCDTVCASRGGCNLTGIKDYAGSSGSDANCEAVLTALGKPGTPFASSLNGVGCIYLGANIRDSFTTTCAATNGSAERACACAN